MTTDPLTEFYGDPISVYTVADGVADGSMIPADRMLAEEAGYRIPVVLTAAAHADLIEWDDEPAQDETGRLWDVLYMMKGAARMALSSPGTRQAFKLYRVPFRTPSGARSKAETAQLVTRHVVCQGYDQTGLPCLTILLPEED